MRNLLNGVDESPVGTHCRIDNTRLVRFKETNWIFCSVKNGVMMVYIDNISWCFPYFPRVFWLRKNTSNKTKIPGQMWKTPVDVVFIICNKTKHVRQHLRENELQQPSIKRPQVQCWHHSGKDTLDAGQDTQNRVTCPPTVSVIAQIRNYIIWSNMTNNTVSR